MNYLKNIYIKNHSFFILLFLSFAGVSLGQIAKKIKVFILAGNLIWMVEATHQSCLKRK